MDRQTSKFDENFIKNYEESDDRYFLKIDTHKDFKTSTKSRINFEESS